ncbi:hypothetical protein C7M84_005316 [Penaeus vannamei]|uniref:Band 7 domain-containing protein n=1 Tax=Penaeus vannamei TaxID=6689 RepID=A0A423TI19_PENVA|nr:hypothetical protein C7M84_005316 [Penaeus vannamei]
MTDARRFLARTLTYHRPARGDGTLNTRCIFELTPGTLVLTRDSVTVAVDGVIYFSVKNALRVVTVVSDYRTSSLSIPRPSHLPKSIELSHTNLAFGSSFPQGAEAQIPHSHLNMAWLFLPGFHSPFFALHSLRIAPNSPPFIAISSPCSQDTSIRPYPLHPQKNSLSSLLILTRDSVTVAVDGVIYFRVKDTVNAVTQIQNYSHSTRLLAATTLRNVLGTRNLAEILSERESISATMQSSLDDATDPWGVKVERVEIKDVRLPVQLQRAMAAEAEAAREARAKVIAAEGEQRASRALKEAAEVINESPAALQVHPRPSLPSPTPQTSPRPGSAPPV